MTEQFSYLNDLKVAKLLFAVLVKRAGGNVQITQADIDDVAYSRLNEDGQDGSVKFTLVERKATQ